MTKTTQITTVMIAVLLLGSTTGLSFAQNDFSVTKTANPIDINVLGSGIDETTTITITVTGFGGETINEIDGDIMLVLDESGSLDSNEFNQMRNFAIALVNAFDFTNTNTQMGVALFSGNSISSTDGKLSRVLVSLTDDKTTLLNALNGMTSQGGFTCIGCGLERAVDEFTANGIPGNVPITIVLTDGQNNRPISNPSTFLNQQVQSLANLGSVNVAIGIGNGVDQSELLTIAGDPSRVFLSPNFAELQALIDTILEDVVVNNAPSQVSLVETTNEYIVNHSTIVPSPDSQTTLVGGQVQLVWNDIGSKTDVGDTDGLLEEGETFTVSFDVQSNQIGDNLDVNDLTNSEITFVSADSTPGSSPLVQTTINVNGAPIADPQFVSIDEDTPKDIVLTGSDPNGDVLTFTIDTNPMFGTLSDFNANTGQVKYTPDENFWGFDSFTFTVNDGTLTSILATVDIEVIAVNDPPTCDDATASVVSLWPPNHKFSDVTVNMSTTDVDGDSVLVMISSIFQDEPVDGTGSGDTAPDAEFSDDDMLSVKLRAERSGNENGRVYTISVIADDGHGGSCTGQVLVGVPHDKKDIPFNDGATYDSTQIP
ncbi:MAG: VWA domain-containing protein [Nitrosopumilus sp.]|uniref:VWA domain-containing protein n=1 Tax=Nitrosopumilus sp. TaxID=2024843 RepID=UPI00247D03A8|nr:VWA domain-containing protein [Nitrosopumilus sp.]MCV0392993.1 VWA domain-containing protein [Nitrosopumilus sp.]